MQLSCKCIRPFAATFSCVMFAVLLATASAFAQESPFFVTYTHHMEEPGNLDIEASSTSGTSRIGQKSYFAPYTEFEYGVTAQWTSEFYLEGQSTFGDSSAFTGWRFENRYKLLPREHWINPVLYLEYENVNEASRIQKEIEGSAPDVSTPNALLTPIHNHELEGKLIFSSDHHDWNIAENFIAAKNFSQSEGVEFGYSIGVSRPLATLASGTECRFCRENFIAGAELYGGLGSTLSFGLRDTAHYFAPVLAWAASANGTFRFSPGFALNHQDSPALIRFGYTYEIQNFGGSVSKLFGKHL